MMVFHRKQKHIKELNIAINGAKIDRVESVYSSEKGYQTNFEQFLHLSHKFTIHKA